MNQHFGYNICEGCKWSSLHTCHKYNKECISLNVQNKRIQLCCTDCLDNEGYEEGEPWVIEEPERIGYFHLPGFRNWKYFKQLIDLFEKYPETFYPNRRISEIYGNFPGATWNGRTPDFSLPTLSVQNIELFRQELEAHNLAFNITFNNHLIEERDLYDRFCNGIAEVFHNGKHSITVASPLLYQYLKENYPNYTYYQSVIATETDKEFVKKDSNMDIFLWNRRLNNNWEELLKVPFNERPSIEFLCNDGCTPICDRSVHYNYVNACLLQRSDENGIGNYCTIDHDFMGYNTARWPMTIRPDQIDEYIDNNFIHFKLCSRNDHPILLMYKCIQYLIQPKYHEVALDWCVSNVYKT